MSFRLTFTKLFFCDIHSKNSLCKSVNVKKAENHKRQKDVFNREVITVAQVSEKAMKSMIETMIANVDPQQVRTLAQTFDIPTINIWLKQCQENAKKGTKHGFVHQDLVNLLGEKLGFNVSYGKHKSGYDGIWKFDKLSIVIESKANIQWHSV